ncbi:MAG: hypothetical protein J5J00_05085 [Deltaproteobacteria bacterium]|nr:hypothetical protein [Deltaproteobacteria bacterium]
MTDKTLKIAVFEAQDAQSQQLKLLFANTHHYQVRWTRTVQDIVKLSPDDSPEAIVVPSVLFDRSPCVTTCLQIKAQESLAALPILVCSWVKDLPAVSTMYGAGADVVLTPPLDADIVYHQLTALCRLTRAFKEELDENLRDRGLRQALVSSLHFIEDPVVILDSSEKLVFANRASREVLRIYNAPDRAMADAVLEPLATAISSELQKVTLPDDSGTPIVFQTMLKRATGEEFTAELRVISLRAPDDSIVAYCATLHDLTTPRELSATLGQMERLFSVSLLMAAACHELLNTDSLGSPGHALVRIEKALESQVIQCPLLPLVTAVLELLDIVISSRTSIKVQLPADQVIAIKPGDLFQLVGHLLVYASRYAGHHGSTTIRSQPSKRPGYLTLLIKSHGDPLQITPQERQTTAYIRTKLLRSAKAKSDRLTDNLAFGVIVAQSIARSYGIDISDERTSDYELSIRVDLPLK